MYPSTIILCISHAFSLQKSRKIFDPADHDQPRKRKAASPVVNVVDSNSAAAPQATTPPAMPVTTSSSASPLIDDSGCIYCGLTSPKQRKGGRQESLVRCKDCPTSGLYHLRTAMYSLEKRSIPHQKVLMYMKGYITEGGETYFKSTVMLLISNH